MPNHIINRIKMIGEPAEINKVRETVKSDKYGIGTIDFEKIIPMPDNIFRGDLGPTERKLYGNNNWYDWSISNWGTKWGAYGYDESKNYSFFEDSFHFFTAWSAPHPVLAKLAEMFPAVTFEHKWADEDIGVNCGRQVYYDGVLSDEYYPDYGRESFEFSASVWNKNLEEDYDLYLNASETGYINIEYKDDYELIELFDQPALFTNNRITDADVPKGMYCYHLRHDDNGESCTIEKRVAVNHAGSVVTKSPIDFGTDGYISFTEDTSPDFKGETMSLYEFREYIPDQEPVEGESEDMGMEMKL